MAADLPPSYRRLTLTVNANLRPRIISHPDGAITLKVRRAPDGGGWRLDIEAPETVQIWPGGAE